jgi:hypothetical protein
MSVGLTELTPGVGSTEPGKSAAVGLADGEAGKERRSRLCRRLERE